jgi:hypothetical protein
MLESNTGLAQLVEHWSPKPGVGSSSLSTRARYMENIKCTQIKNKILRQWQV